MTVEYKGQTFMTDNDLRVNLIGCYPRIDLLRPKLWELFKKQARTRWRLGGKFKREYGRDFLSGDEIISFSQKLVSGEVDFEYGLLEDILNASKNPEKTLREIVFSKTATGIGSGHSMGGLSGIVLNVNGTKMIDSGLTGLVMSRSLVTSSRRRETEEIMIPEFLFSRLDLLDEYLEISRDVLNLKEEFKGKLGSVEIFNKVIPYNNPANLLIVLPLDTLATLAFEVEDDKLNQNGIFLPREIYNLVGMFPELTKKVGLDVMYKQRISVPRDTYLHYSVFRDPKRASRALNAGKENEMGLEPIVRNVKKESDKDFRSYLDWLKGLFDMATRTNVPELLYNTSMKCMYALRDFTNEYNNAVELEVVDSLSWRVWSEQKRHATLKQNVESVYSAADRASRIMGMMRPAIESAYKNNYEGDISELVENVEKAIIIDDRLKKKPELVIPYIYHTARQLGFYRKLLDEGFDVRDVLYIVPKNIRVRTLENYDLKNLISLELPLRLCSTCEPERQASSWKKRDVIAEAVPEIGYFLYPKCRMGFCTERKYCYNIVRLRKGKYSEKLHKAVKQEMLDRARYKIR